jgi:hypothetical protein
MTDGTSFYLAILKFGDGNAQPYLYKVTFDDSFIPTYTELFQLNIYKPFLLNYFFDGTYFYFGGLGTPPYAHLAKYDGTTIIYSDGPSLVIGYDGTYLYLQTNNGGLPYAYKTTDDFMDINSYKILPPLTANATRILTGYRYNYLYEYTGKMFQFDPTIIVPSVQGGLVLEYVTFENPQPTTFSSLIETYEMNTFTLRGGKEDDTFSLTFKNAVREFWIFSTSPLGRIVFNLNTELLFDEDQSSTVNVRPFVQYTSTPSKPMAIYAFAMHSYVPSGHLNISRVKFPFMTFYTATPQATDTTITVYSRGYNVAAYSGGIGGILFD